MTRKLVYLIAFGLAAYTQLAYLTEVPGLHFDEGWQGTFAYRILSVPGFHPLSAMNSYTSPVIHYLLAGVFAVFGPTLEAMRGTYAALNLASLALIAGLLWRRGERAAVGWFALLWALLPLAVHNHRFYVEVTGFHTFCLAIVLWGFAFWKRRPGLSCALIAGGIVVGTYSHILFISVFVSALIVAARAFPREFQSRRAQILIATTALLLLPLPIRMGLGLKKATPFLLALALALTAAWAGLAPRIKRFRPLWEQWPRYAKRLSTVLLVLSIPFLVAFIGLLWNGSWPYAQATGRLMFWWVPINAAIFLGLAAKQWRKPNTQYSLMWGAFITTFAVTSALILKQTPRYYSLPMVFAMIWCAQLLARLNSRGLQASIAVAFTAWNLWAFHIPYVRQFQSEGSTTKEFNLWIFHDNGRDFRPFQKVWKYIVEQNCQRTLYWVEDDRFSHPVQFLRLRSPEPKGRCPWPQDDLFFSHIPNYDPNLNGRRTDTNTPPPVENVKFLAHFPEWGDLALWIRR